MIFMSVEAALPKAATLPLRGVEFIGVNYRLLGQGQQDLAADCWLCLSLNRNKLP